MISISIPKVIAEVARDKTTLEKEADRYFTGPVGIAVENHLKYKMFTKCYD